MKEAKHWYDGVIYDRFIAPNQDVLFAAIRRVIRPGSTVLDVGCGTGRLAFQLAAQCRLVHGIDLSAANIRRARNRRTRRASATNVEFFHRPLEEHLSLHPSRYDVAVMTYVIHEVDESERLPLLNLLAKSAHLLLLGDYRVPRQRGVYDAATEVVEFFAGRDHYRGFRSFVRRGGLEGEVQRAGLAGVEERGLLPRWTQLLLVNQP